MDGNNVVLLWSCHQECSSLGLVRSRLNKPAGGRVMIHGCKESRKFLNLENVWLISILEDMSMETLVIVSIGKLDVNWRALS